MPISRQAIAKYISPKIIELTECNLANLVAEYPLSNNWVPGIFLMIIFNNQPPEHFRPAAIQFLRRIEMVITEYSHMSVELKTFLSGKPEWSPPQYYRILHHGEVAVVLLYVAYDLLRKILVVDLYKDGDGSPIQRLNRIYSAIKHKPSDAQDAVWLSNEGFHTDKDKVLYSEFEELIRWEIGRAHV